MADWINTAFYFISVLLLVPLWILIYVTRIDLRYKLIRTGFIFGIASVILGLLFTHDYWNPSYLISPFFPFEDFLYGIVFGGLTTVIYQYIFNVKFLNKTTPSSRKMTLTLGLICILIMFISVSLLNVNSIYGQIACLLFVGIYTLIKRKDLLKHMLLSGVVVTLFTFIWQKIILLIYPNAVTDFWETESLLNIFYWGVPLEELLFAFFIGLSGSLYFEFSRGFKTKK